MLRIISSNRQEDLLDRLAERLAQAPCDEKRSPLAPETLIAERGTDTWLWQQLAQRHGIAAGLDMQVPGSFIWHTLQALFPQEKKSQREAAWDSAAIAWRLMTLLPQHLHEPAFADLRHYLVREEMRAPSAGRKKKGAPPPEPRRLQALCTRIAALFDQYLVYRPELLLAWEENRALGLGSDENWQQVLWRDLVAVLPAEGHRARLMLAFEQQCRRGALHDLPHDALPPRVSVFGIPALPPNYLMTLARLANVIDVDFYLLNPSTAFWGDLLAPAQAARLRAELTDSGAALIDVGNRLLASWGQQSRDFIASLNSDCDALCETRHEDLCEGRGAPSRRHRLAQVQADILELTETAQEADPAADASIQVHATHGRMREVEVLHDRLLDLFRQMPDLAPRDVLVLAPDIGAYAPLVDAVFGTADGDRHLPWSIADLPRRAEEPLLAAIEQLVRLPSSRLRASDVLALLEMPAIRRAARIDDDHLEDIRHWIAVANIRWGYDASHRESLGLPGENAHTWAFGLRRLFLGAAVSGQEELLQGAAETVAPCTQVEGQRATALGLLCAFVDALHAQQPLLAGADNGNALSPAQWQARVHALLNTFVRARGDNEQDIVEMARDALAAQARELVAGGLEGTALDTGVLREDLLARLAAPGRRNDFLGGNITFASLLPQRALPFRVIALLGMNQEDFPRQGNTVGFDLLARQPKPGDRSRRDDDRQLFLETLLSARDVLYISYTGRDIRDDKPRLPSVLVTEFIEYIAALSVPTRKAREDFRRAFVREHPLQPFSARYFLPRESAAGNDHLYTYNADWHGAASARAAQAGDAGELQPWCPAPLPPRADDAGPGNAVALDELIRFLRNPTAWFLQQRLGIRFRDEHEVPLDEEPFELDALDGWQVKTGWVNAALAGSPEHEFRRRLAARGDLPQGALEHLHWRAQQASVATLVNELARRDARGTVPIDITLGSGSCARRLTGQVDGVGVGETGLVAWKAGSIDGKDALAFWVRHLALCAQGELPASAQSFLLDKDGKQQLQLQVLAKDDARRELTALLALRERGRPEPLPLFAKANWKWFEAKTPEAAQDGAVAAFDGNQNLRGDVLDEAVRIAWRCSDLAINSAFFELAETVYGPLRACRASTAAPPDDSDGKPGKEKAGNDKPAKAGKGTTKKAGGKS